MAANDDRYFLRKAQDNGLDSIAFRYSVYRIFQRFLGLDCQTIYDVPVNFVEAWNTLFIQNDFINALTGKLDPRHLYGMSNFDVLRWDGLVNGTQKSAIGTFIASLVMPGAPLVSFLLLLGILTRVKPMTDGSAQLYYGEEQGLYLSTTRLPIISSGKSTSASRACTNTDIL